MTFADKSRYDRTFQQVTHKGGESEINYIKRFQNAHALSLSVGNSYLCMYFWITFIKLENNQLIYLATRQN